MTTSSMRLNPIDHLFNDRQKEIRRIIENLTYEEVKTDNAFKMTLEKIEHTYLLEKVIIGEPKISRHRVEEREVQPNYHNPFGGPQRITIVTVEYPFSGSQELFQYRSNGSLTVGTVHTPSGNSISVDVIVNKLDKAEAISKANEEMGVTKMLININNPEVEKWVSQLKSNIKSALEQRREELKNFYD